ncbi:MAG: DUF4105 domain-containing protein [Elusimicrobia bacterium]|nr:DUF4105 domain-containing protein [Elusimicrobiota bacterium]
MKSKILKIFACAVFLSAGGITLSAGQPALPYPEETESVKHGVTYFLRGIFTRQEEKTVLHTEDGRVFLLEVSPELIGGYEGKTVEIWGKAKQSDEISEIKVTEVKEYEPPAEVIIPPPYKSRFRPAGLLEETAESFKIGDARWIDPHNPSEEYLWKEVVIKPELLKNAYFAAKKGEKGPAGHSLLFFEFEDGGIVDHDGNSSRGFFLSVEAYAREGQSYSVFTGLKNAYGIVWMIITFEEYSLRTAFFGDSSLHFFPILLSREDKIRMAAEAVRLATINREGEFYHTVTNSCTNNLVIVMNRVLPEDKKIKMWIIPSFIYNFRATMPWTVPRYLQRKNLLGPEEFAITKENLREYIP